MGVSSNLGESEIRVKYQSFATCILNITNMRRFAEVNRPNFHPVQVSIVQVQDTFPTVGPLCLLFLPVLLMGVHLSPVNFGLIVLFYDIWNVSITWKRLNILVFYWGLFIDNLFSIMRVNSLCRPRQCAYVHKCLSGYLLLL